MLAAAVPGDLAVATRLRRTYAAELVAAATAQVELRRAAASKFADSDRLWLTRPGLEQATPSPVAEHRARRLRDVVGDVRVLDLCCGIGGDAMAMASAGLDVVAADIDPLHLHMTRLNCASIAMPVGGLVADVTTLRLRRDDVVHIDPARRSAAGDRRGYSPSLDWVAGLPCERVVAKVAPGIAETGIGRGWAADWVSLDRELKAAVLWSPSLAGGSPVRRAVVLRSGGGRADELLSDPAVDKPRVDLPGRWIIDPDPPSLGRVPSPTWHGWWEGG